jgi:serine/threonine protein kinase
MKIAQDRYEIIGTLGTGASSRVEKARDSTIGRTVAVKTFLHGFGSDDLQKQFLREAQIVGRLTHPSIVSLYDVGTNTDGVPYLILEYVEGKTLEHALTAGPLPLERAAVWAADLASALARAHQCKIIHGDIKPANVLVTKEGQVKLSDFGIARFATQVSVSGNILGTPAYLSPEQILGGKQDTRSDLFSLGIVLYQMTTGVRPFDGTSVGAVCAQIVSAEPVPPSHHNPALPPAFDHIVMRCLAKDPKQRYVDAESLGASLYPFARSKPIPMPPRNPYWWKRPMQISDLRVVAGAMLALAVLGVGARAVHQHFSSISLPGLTANSRNAPATSASAPQSKAGAADARDANRPPSPGSLNLQTVSGSPAAPDSSTDASSAAFAVAGSNALFPFPPAEAHAFERHAVASPTPKSIHSAPGAPATGDSSPRPSATLPAQAVTAGAKFAVAPVSKTSLHIDIVSGVADENVSIFAGDELLLSTPLEATHIGDTLRFECPVTLGEHSFRVVLSRSDETVLIEKASTSQIRSDASNFLGVHVSRHAKLFLKHEALLEVVWPSTVAPIATSASQHPEGELAFR